MQSPCRSADADCVGDNSNAVTFGLSFRQGKARIGVGISNFGTLSMNCSGGLCLRLRAVALALRAAPLQYRGMRNGKMRKRVPCINIDGMASRVLFSPRAFRMPVKLPSLSLLNGVVSPEILEAMKSASAQLARTGVRHALFAEISGISHTDRKTLPAFDRKGDIFSANCGFDYVLS